MSSKKDEPWPPPQDVWAQKREQTYQAIPKGTKAILQEVLHITSWQYNSVAIWAENWLKDNNIDGHLGGKSNERLLEQALEDLKSDRIMGSVLSWAEKSGETKKNVDDALRGIIKNQKHNNTRVQERKNNTTKVTQEKDANVPVKRPTPALLEKRPAPVASALYESSIRLRNEIKSRLTPINEDTDLQEVRTRAFDAWKTWYGVSVRDVALHYILSFGEDSSENPLANEEDWQQARLYVRETKKILEVFVTVPSQPLGSPVFDPPTRHTSNLPYRGPSLESQDRQQRSGDDVPAAGNAQALSSTSRGHARKRSMDTSLRQPPSDVLETTQFDGRENAASPSPLSARKRRKIQSEKRASKNHSDSESESEYNSAPPHIQELEHLREDTPPIDEDLPTNALAESNDGTEDELPQDLTSKPEQLPAWIDVPLGKIQHHLSYYPHRDDYDEKASDQTEGDLPKDADGQAIRPIENQLDVEEQHDINEALARVAELSRRATEHYDKNIEREMWEVLKLDQDMYGPMDPIQLPGHVRPVSQYQAYGAWLLIRAEARGMDPTMAPSRSFILGDEPGLGKSCIIAIYLWLNSLLTHAHYLVRHSRKVADGKHLPVEQSDGAVCPSEPFLIRCPCSATSPTFRVKPLHGMIQLVVPPALVTNTFTEWYKQIAEGQEGPLDFELFNCTSLGVGKGQSFFDVGDTGKRDLFTFRLSDERRDKWMGSARVEDAEGGKLPSLAPHWSRKIIITTTTAYQNHFVRPKLDRLPFAKILRDEFHQEASAGTRIITRHRELAIRRTQWSKARTSTILYASGTPTDSGPAGLRGFASLALLGRCRFEDDRGEAVLEFPPDPSTKGFSQWYQTRLLDDDYKIFLPDNMPRMKTRIQSPDPKVREQATQEFATFMKTFYLARGRGSKWHGIDIMPLPRMRYSLVTVGTTKRWLANIKRFVRPDAQEVPQKVTKGEEQAYRAKREKVTGFPYLAELFRQGDLTLDGADFTKRDSHWDTTELHHEENPFRRFRTRLMQSSAKAAQVEAILGQFASRTDFKHRPAAGIIFTTSIHSAVALYHQIWATYDDQHPDQTFKPFLITSNLSQQSKSGTTRSDVCRRFMSHPGLAVLIGTVSIIGTGLTLTRAMFTILFDQISMNTECTQSIGRMLRKTNYNWEGVYVFELYDLQSPEDVRLRALRNGKSNLVRKIEEAMAEELEHGPDPVENDTDDDSMMEDQH